MPQWHIKMMNDKHRNECFKQAIQKLVKPDDLILDIGTGSGLLAMYSRDAGSQQVVACEQNPLIAEAAKKIIKDNSMSDYITVINSNSKNIKVGKELPRKADLIVSEIFSSEMVGEGILETFLDSRNRLLAEDGQVIPESSEIKIALIASNAKIEEASNPGWCNQYNMKSFEELRPTKLNMDLYGDAILLSEEKTVFEFNFKNIQSCPRQEEVIAIKAISFGNCVGIVQWFKATLCEDVFYENTPGKIKSHWNNNVYLFGNSISVSPGEEIKIKATMNKDFLWFQDL